MIACKWGNVRITLRDDNGSMAWLPLVGKHAQSEAGGTTAPCSLALRVRFSLLSLCPAVLPAPAPVRRRVLSMWCAQAAS